MGCMELYSCSCAEIGFPIDLMLVSQVISGVEVGDEASLSSFHRDIGNPINFQEESGLGTF